MARRRRAPAAASATSSPRYRTPDVSTWLVAGIAIAWYVGIYLLSENALFDSLTALSLLIAFYYALTGVACAVYYRRHLTESATNLLLIGVGPVVGALMLIWLLVLVGARHVRPGQLLQRPGLVRGRARRWSSASASSWSASSSCSTGALATAGTGTSARPCPTPTWCAA